MTSDRSWITEFGRAFQFESLCTMVYNEELVAVLDVRVVCSFLVSRRLLHVDLLSLRFVGIAVNGIDGTQRGLGRRFGTIS